MRRPRLAPVVIIFAFLMIAQAGAAPIAAADSASTAAELDAARRTLADAQAAANAAAEAITEAEGRLEQLHERIDTLETQMTVTQQRVDELSLIVRQRAVDAYTHAGDTGVTVVLDAENPLQAARRARLLDRANEKDHVATRKLAALRSDLDGQRNEVRAQRDEQKRVREQLEVKNAEVRAHLASAAKARDDLIVRLEAERAAEAAAAAELARLRAAQAAAAAAQAAAAQAAAAQNAARQLNSGGGGGGGGGSTGGGNGGGGGGAPGQIIANPVGGSFQCPVNGSAYSNNYGPRGSGFHYGIDMFASTGAPLVAVKPGSVRYVSNEGAGGNTAYLSADDGNTYFYAHLSSFVGGARSVAQGEIIGLVGATGNASGPHLHFEIRVGGVNGSRTNPYPTLQGAGC
jgi:murein DD-endopeptidase MepM/ murein hydrolase activator NlpD